MKRRRAGPPPAPFLSSAFRAKASLVVATLGAAMATTLNGCVPMVVVAGAGAGALMATDRRSAGTQVDDEAIELKIGSATNDRWGDAIHLNVTSYNGIVLLTGEAPSAAVQSEITNLAKATDRVRSVYNEMVVGPTTALSARTNDTYLTSKVKAGFVETSKFAPTHVKVVTERAVVYLMGMVNRDEAEAATQIAATTTGVARVVRLFEYTS